MRCLLIFLLFLSLMSGCWSCGGNANSNEQANANTSVENPYAHITDAREALAEGNRLLDENDTELAIAAFKRAVEIDPELADGWFQLGIAYSLRELREARSGQVSDASVSNSKQRIKPNSEIAFEKAVDAYKKWLKEKPDDDAAQFNLGRTYAKLNRDGAAEDAFREAVKLKPDDTEYQTELGAILIKLARYSEAIGPLKEAVALDETNSRAQDLLEDAEAGRQRLNYVAPANANLSNANMMANANSAKSVNSNSNSNSNSAPRKTPAANTKPKRDDKKPSANSPSE